MDTPPTMEVPPGQPPPSPEERAKRLVGRVLSDRYRLYELIATGGMGAVYRADHLFLKKRVAVKLLHPEMENMPDLVARFEREAVAGAHVRHPNVAAATDFGKLEDGSYFLVLEHIRGKTLSEVIRGGPLAPARAAAIARQIAAALDAVHAMGVIHRDIKPRNVMLIEGDVVKVVDFGLALVRMERLSRPSVRPPQPSLPNPARLTFSGEVFGTAAYLAPEAAYGMDRVDGRADLYALGVVLYEMLAGKRPFESDDTTEILLMHRSKRPPPLGDGVPPELEAVTMRLLAKDAAERYQTGAELIRALDAIFPPEEKRPSRRPTPLPPPLRQNWVLLVATGVGVLITLEGYRLLRPRAPEAPPPPAAALAPTAGAAATASTEEALYTGPVRGAANEPPPETERAISPGRAEAPAGADTARLLFLRSARAHDYRGAGRALIALADKDAAAFRDPEVVLAARDVVVSLDPDTLADDVFDVLSSRLGGPGLDVLYAVVEVRGGTRAAARAADLLRRRDLISAASPELRIAFALREAPCEQKPALFDRAAQEGDARALAVLETLGRSCFVHNQQLEDTIAALRAKTGRPRP